MIYLPLYVTYIISMAEFKVVRDWSLIMGRGCLQNGRGGEQVKFYPYKKKGGGRTSFSHAEGGHNMF